MKIKFLGTAAAEGIPAVFCMCDACVEARKRKGKNIRTRSQAIIDDKILIDFPADTFVHCLNNDIELAKIKHCLITHTHSDHLYLNELEMRLPVFSHLSTDSLLTFYGLEGTMKKIDGYVENELSGKPRMVATEILKPYIKTQIDEYTVTALNATHDVRSYPAFYIIEDSEGKSILYAHDTNYFSEEVWKYLDENKPKFSLVSVDCTEAMLPAMHYVGHMNLNDNVRIKNKLVELGCADENTIFISNHFSHNGVNVLYEEFSEAAEKEKFITAFDGLEIAF